MNKKRKTLYVWQNSNALLVAFALNMEEALKLIGKKHLHAFSTLTVADFSIIEDSSSFIMYKD